MLGITAVRTRGTFLRRTVRKYFSRTNTFKKYVLITQKKIILLISIGTQGVIFESRPSSESLVEYSYSPMQKKLILRTLWKGSFFGTDPLILVDSIQDTR